jgi:hypothetical protein
MRSVSLSVTEGSDIFINEECTVNEEIPTFSRKRREKVGKPLQIAN